MKNKRIESIALQALGALIGGNANVLMRKRKE